MPNAPSELQPYVLHAGDCIPIMDAMPAASVDFAVFSPPFPAVYAYTDSASDIGNSEGEAEGRLHLSFFFRRLARVLKPGRVAMVHCNQLPRMKRSGGRGLRDFRGDLIRIAGRAGLVYEYDWVARINPQAQAITTKSRELQFAGLESDRARSRGALGDILIKFTAPGDNAVPVVGGDQVSRDDWIDWAEAAWDAEPYPTNPGGTHKGYTLNAEAGRSEDDTRHICPMRLSLVDRLVRLYTNPGEVVFDPFSGIGTTGYVSLRLGRLFRGCELKPEYRAASIRKFDEAVAARSRVEGPDLFSLFDADPVEDADATPPPAVELPARLVDLADPGEPAGYTDGGPDRPTSGPLTVAILTCTRCNLDREASEGHPCPKCRNPEFGYSERPAEAIVANPSLRPGPTPIPLPGQMGLFSEIDDAA